MPDELNVTYSWESQTIEKESEVLFEIIWRPTCQESSYHKISFETTRKTHIDVSIIFKSISPKVNRFFIYFNYFYLYFI